jgi:hypothetical protein
MAEVLGSAPYEVPILPGQNEKADVPKHIPFKGIRVVVRNRLKIVTPRRQKAPLINRRKTLLQPVKKRPRIDIDGVRAQSGEEPQNFFLSIDEGF